MNRVALALVVVASLLSVNCAYDYPAQPTSTTPPYTPPPVTPPAETPAGVLTAQVNVTSGATQGVPMWLLYAITRGTNAPTVQAAKMTFGDGDVVTLDPAVANATLSHTYGRSGSFPITLTVTDALGRTVQGTTSAFIPAPPPVPEPPPPPAPQPAPVVVTLTSDFPSVLVNGTLNFTAAPSALHTSAGETVTSYQWDLDGDGTNEFTSTAPTHPSGPYPKAGLFTARVLMTTSEGRHAQGTVNIVVTN